MSNNNEIINYKPDFIDYDHYKNSQSKANETLLNAIKDALEDVHIESGRKEEHENVVNQIYKSILLAFNARG